ncbi:hypothetical protein D9M72_531150 [compost metagenome]
MVEGVLCVDDAPGHGRGAGAVLIDEAHGMRAGFGVQNVVDVALPPDRDVLGLVLGNRAVTHASKKLGELLRFRMGEFDEFEAVGASGVFSGNRCRRGVMREGAHRKSPLVLPNFAGV